jgi:hypothetical protein
MLGAGVSPRVALERLGHAPVTMTLERHSRVPDSVCGAPPAQSKSEHRLRRA